MKTFIIIIVIFAIIIGVVYQTGYLSHTEESRPTPKPPKVEEPKPEVKIVYVPQIIEKVYVKEVVRTEKVIYRDRPQPVSQPVQSRCYPNDCCIRFTGLLRTRCYQYLNRGYTCQQYNQLVAYYNPQIYGGGR